MTQYLNTTTIYYYMLNPVIDFRIRADGSLQKKVAALKRKLNLTNSSLVKLAIARLWEEENKCLTDEEFDKLLEEFDNSKKPISCEEITEIANEAVREVRKNK